MDGGVEGVAEDATMSFTSRGEPYAVMWTSLRMSPLRSMIRPVFWMRVVRCLMVTVAFCVPAGSLAGLTSKPCVAVSVMSPVRFRADTVKVWSAPVPFITRSSLEVVMAAKGGAYAPVGSMAKYCMSAPRFSNPTCAVGMRLTPTILTSSTLNALVLAPHLALPSWKVTRTCLVLALVSKSDA